MVLYLVTFITFSIHCLNDIRAGLCILQVALIRVSEVFELKLVQLVCIVVAFDAFLHLPVPFSLVGLDF